MSNAVFPIDLPGLSIKLRRTPIFKTRVQEAASGREFRARYQREPRYRYRLRYEFLRSDPPLRELQQLVQFFEDHYGRWDSFYFDDPYDGIRRRVRFYRDNLDVERFLIHLWELKSLELISVK
ncbi:DUF2460 domain-containing protein [Microbulbifer sp. 2205BS26-8]|uniref:DUF2460 domain-containing protein n=1 Tax=Microbulbifer sp. 2205BS26-8 TaxID=3064386 RepID=UPI00273D22E7|nr:DUF2460 domain-containing protein [Microbulbifer sp. 2205BS26-8]MDP5209991.1 DUF2460 domain-containing protein [Microbulbifer sp. 2205BS26-8]